MDCTPSERDGNKCARKNEIGFMVKQGIDISERIPRADSPNDTISEV